MSDEVIDFGLQVEAQLVMSRRPRDQGQICASTASPQRIRCHPTSSGNGGRVAPSTLATADTYASQILTS